jgi:hypothetical protein
MKTNFFHRIFRNSIHRKLELLNDRVTVLMNLCIKTLQVLEINRKPPRILIDGKRFVVACAFCGNVRQPDGSFKPQKIKPGTIVSHTYCRACARKNYPKEFHRLRKCSLPFECCNDNCKCHFVDVDSRSQRGTHGGTHV